MRWAIAGAGAHPQGDLRRAGLGSYTNADGSGLYWDLLKQVYAPYGLDVKFINMPWNRANKLMTAGSMVDGVPGEIPGVEGKLYAQLPIDIEYHGVMHAAKTPFSGRASLTGKRVAGATATT